MPPQKRNKILIDTTPGIRITRSSFAVRQGGEAVIFTRETAGSECLKNSRLAHTYGDRAKLRG
jgi:hypothetical protein